MRSFLFVPADGGTKLDKAMASGADGVIVDLEDLISPQRKAEARKPPVEFLKKRTSDQEGTASPVRAHQWFADRDDRRRSRRRGVGFARTPCCRKPRAVRLSFIAMQRSPRAKPSTACPMARPHRHLPRDRKRRCFSPEVMRAQATALKGMTWGPEDLSVELGAEANRDRDGKLLALSNRARLVPPARRRRKCRRSRLSSSISATKTGLRHETEEARRDGFTGRMAIHPAQVAVINEVFTPRAEAITRRGGGRGVCGRARRRHRRHRRQDVRPAASRAGPALLARAKN